MTSDRDNGRSRGVRTIAVVAALAGIMLALVGCSSDPEPERATVTPSGAYIAVVLWEIDRSEPVVDADGKVEEPVIYLTAGAGGTIDVGVQADVVSTIDDAAVIRFADDASDALDDGLDQEPVKDDGVMIVIGEIEPDRASVEARIIRYRSIDDVNQWTLEVRATDDGAAVVSASLVEE